MKASINNIERFGIVLITLILFVNFFGFTSTISAQTSTETDFINILNTQRISLGKNPLSINSSLSTAAYLHSKDMAENNYFSHTSQDGTTFVQRIEAAGYTNWTSLAENIAYYYGAHDATVIYNLWLNSPGHYANMIGDVTEAGLGVYTLNNYTYCTLDLGKSSYPVPPTIGCSPSSFTFTAIQGGTNPPNQTLNLQNTGTGTLNWSMSDNATWLDLSPVSGNSTGEVDPVTASVNISGMTSGNYSATITVSATGATNTPRTVPVTLVVNPPVTSPTIGFSPSSFTFTAIQGGTNPPNQTLNLQNTGTGTLNWSMSDNATWLDLSPVSGSSTGEVDPVTASVNISGMTSGNYSATITISATGATNTPRTVPVNLIINSSPATTDVTVSLEAGWNMVSVPWYVAGTGTAPDIFFAGLGTNLNAVYSYDACTSTWSSWNKVTGGSLTMDDGMGYWVNVTSAAQVTLTGTLNSTNPLDPLPQYAVCAGWNLIGFKNGSSAAAITAYIDPPLNVASIYTFDNGTWTIPANLVPGQAYWVYFTTPGVIIP